MDAGSRLVAELAAAAAPPGAARVWDCCAAPGGKTMILARRLPGAQLLATDTSPVRLQRLQQRIARELPGHQLRFAQADAAALPAAGGRFDLVLCDVPCSGTGTLARNPEIRHRLEPADLGRQADRQLRILRGAVERLAPGGRLVYSTCSLEREENAAVVERALKESSHPVRLASAEGLVARLTESGVLRAGSVEGAKIVQGEFLRTLPGVGFPGDGFFAAVLERA